MTGPDRIRRIDVDYLARVEGEGAMRVLVRDGTVEEVEFRIFEPPRFFEAFLVDRPFTDAPDITARICGICPVAYQMSAVRAMEDACGVRVDGQLDQLRRLLYCGEWIESHALHLYLLHAPDFLGYESAVEMAQQHGDLVRQGLELKKIGNEIVTLLGGREIHPINVRVGGFYRVPTRAELAPLAERIGQALELALATVEFTAGLEFPDVERDFVFVTVGDEDRYPVMGDRVVSNRGLDIPVAEYNEHFVEEHVARSNALHARLDGQPYHVGPLARYSLHSDQLTPAAWEAAARAGLGPVCSNPFRSIVVRAVELVFACEEALRVIDQYQPPAEPAVAVPPRPATGHGVSEAPRGLLYHRYSLEADGRIRSAQIVPPTSQNQLSIEADLRAVLDVNLDLPDDDLQWRLEQTIRNYDPCISCATHFLDLTIERR